MVFLIFGGVFALWIGWWAGYSFEHRENTLLTIVFDFCSLTFLFFGLKFFYRVENKKITVVPGLGLKFDDKTLAFKDLESIGQRTNPTPGASKRTKFLVVGSYGTCIRLTENVTPGIAHQLEEALISLQS